MEVVITTFLAAACSMCSLMFCAYVITKQDPEQKILYSVNGIIMGLIIITPLAGFVSPGSAIIVGVCGGPLFLIGENLIGRFNWFSDPAGLFPGHLVGGLFGVVMIAFLAQQPFAAGSGFPTLPNGLFFGGGSHAIHQLGIELLGIGTVTGTVFALSFGTVVLLSRVFGGILDEPIEEQAEPVVDAAVLA